MICRNLADLTGELKSIWEGKAQQIQAASWGQILSLILYLGIYCSPSKIAFSKCAAVLSYFRA